MTSKERPLIVYFSGTGQTEKLVNKINPDNSFETLRVKTGKEVINRDYILITPTYMKGEMPVQIKKLINNNHPLKKLLEQEINNGVNFSVEQEEQFLTCLIYL